MGFLWEKADSDCLSLAVLGVSIGVDDTIHFLTRYRVESSRSKSTKEAIQRTFAFAGRAIVITTVILVVGFLPFVMSDYLSTRIFGTIFPVCLIIALAADVLLVLAMAQLGWIRFRKQRSGN